MAISQILTAEQVLDTWWREHAAVAPCLPSAQREAWLAAISRVIRFYRRHSGARNPQDRAHFALRCRISLAQTRVELSSCLTAGQIPVATARRLAVLDENLTSLLPHDNTPPRL